MDSTWLSNRTAIAGIGATEFSKNSGRSEMQLAVEAIHAALGDAGLEPEDVDGLVSFTVDGNAETEIARNLGIPALTFFSRIGFGGGAAGAVIQQAAMAVASGVARTVVVYRALNERSGNRFGAGVHDKRQSTSPGPEAAVFSWYLPFGLVTPAAWVAMCATRYMHEFGAASEDFGRVAVAARRHAATNPAAWFHGKPITLADHRRRAGSSSRCTCSTVARRATAPSRSSSCQPSTRGISGSLRPSSPPPRRAAARASTR